jgi:DNA-binding response OmpR family regulator
MKEKTQKKEILIIDDDPVQTRLLQKRLDDNGYRCTVTSQAAEGLQLAMDRFPALIILDVMMPIINGYNLCHLLKREKTHQSIPIILLTSRDKEKDKQLGITAGADAYLTKPVDISILLEHIERLI